jgi:RND superfamily putative drug exporter
MKQDSISYSERLAEWIADNSWRTISLWLIVFATSIPLAIILQSHVSPSGVINGTESAYVEKLVEDRFGADLRGAAILTVVGLRPAHDIADKNFLKSTVEAVRALPQVADARSIIDVPNGLMVGADGTGALIMARVRRGADARELEDSLHQIAAGIEEQAAGMGRDLRLYWTGKFFLQADVIEASKRGAREGEMTALPLTLILLLAVFGSLRAALCPIISAVVAVAVSIGLAGLITLILPWSPSVLLQNLISIIGLALAIDYSLLTVSRFREASETGLSPRQAAITAAAKSAPTILLAGTSVLLGFAALLLVPIGEIRSIGIGGLLASLLAMLTTTTLLPAVLGLLAPRIALGRPPAGGERAKRFLAVVARVICKRPRTFLLISAVPLVLLSLPMQTLKITIPNEGWLSHDATSTRGLEALAAIGRRGLTNEILVVAETPETDIFLSATGWAQAHDIYANLAVLDDVLSVIALPRRLSAKLSPETLQGLPRRTLDPLLSDDNRTMLFRVLPVNDLSYNRLERLVHRIRALNLDPRGGRIAPEIAVGGLPASTVDYVAIVRSWMPFVFGLVILGAFVVLAVAFRSPVVALKAVLLNLFSVGAAFGLATLVFIDGYGASLIGVHGPVDGVFPAMPLIVFCAVFGVSMDYEVFLISRIAAARRAAPGETAAIIRGISETGMVITLAAAIMILVFGAFVATDFLPVKMLGFTLAAAVFLDATIVRIVMGPALMRLAGRWNWWPGF